MTVIRDAIAADAEALGRLHIRTWREAYWGVLPEAAVERETEASRVRFWRTHLWRLERDGGARDESVAVALDSEGRLVAYVWSGPARRTPAPWDGEIYMLYVLKEAQRRGLGRAMMGAAARRLVRRGFFRLGLLALVDNGTARAIYEALGGSATGRGRQMIAGGHAEVMGYVWDDASVLLDASPAAR